MVNYRISLIPLGLLFLIQTIQSQVNSKLQQQLEKLLQDKFYTHAHIGISVRDVATKTLLAEVDKDKFLTPASVLKLVTTLTSLDILGEDYRFHTKLSHDGYVDDFGILKGNLYVEGGGDPSFASDRINGVPNLEKQLEIIASDLKKYGIQCIEGDVIIDESIFDSFPVAPTWQWNDLGNYYAGGAWGLNVNENLYDVYFNCNGPIGSAASINGFAPIIPDLKLSNEVTIDSSNTGDNVYIFGGPYLYNKRAVGTVPQGKSPFKVKGSIPDPPSFFGYKLLKYLEKRDMGGWNLKSQYHPLRKKNTRTFITEYLSPKLSEIVRYANDFSINLYAESILKILGFEQRKSGSGADGIAVIEKYLTSKSLDTKSCIMADGCGLSARNGITPDFLTSFLCQQASNKTFDQLSEIIPPVGKRGTVRSLLQGTKFQHKFIVKSGSMDRVLTYAGYCKTMSGKFVAFSVLLNDSEFSKSQENRIKLEKILESMYKSL